MRLERLNPCFQFIHFAVKVGVCVREGVGDRIEDRDGVWLRFNSSLEVIIEGVKDFLRCQSGHWGISSFVDCGEVYPRVA